MSNAQVTMNGQQIPEGQSVAVGGSATSAIFTVVRQTAGQATTVRFTANDLCGPWTTFVGAGTAVAL